MREIKFRFWDTQFKKFVESVAIINNGTILEIDVTPFFPNQDKYIAQQYTGLKDKNGVEIYEGDYVLYPHKSGPFIVGLELSEEKTNWVQCEVKWKTGGLAAYWGHNDCNIVTFNFKQFIVVGNIFEGVDE